eukprot:TRINITY_DN15326_c0_g1_i1.p1 TRINITY_DN15326_c0_g1~~TRINITY_DN15326_c0_g1_i1.p1  ORF type:complete len:427 (+),score=88.05 TRINITY_DN15326_c0_g1_i1:36-1316(+)
MIRQIAAATSLNALRRVVVAKQSCHSIVRTLATIAEFPGASGPIVNKPTFRSKFDNFPVYRVMDPSGVVKDESQIPEFTKEAVVKKYVSMLQIGEMDAILYDAQRQGRISFYMTSAGEEGIHIGTAAALSLDDVIFAQYREVGVFLWRGFTLDDVMNQCFSTHADEGKGRQMPVHYGSRKANIQTISSPLATQIPQAAGAGYAMKLAKSPGCCVCYFGDGAASEGDFHAALNMAATTQASTMFICRNNGWAISTPTSEQYRGDGIAVRGPSYGIDTIRVDGNDIFAVQNATAKARELTMTGRPTLLELMSYRRGHHSTSDDSTRYRGKKEIEWWNEHDNPVKRLRLFLQGKGWWSDAQETETRKELRQAVLAAIDRADKKPKAAIPDLFYDVYDQPFPLLREQAQDLQDHLAKYGDKYPISSHLQA